MNETVVPKKEFAIDFLRRWINHLEYEDESILQSLPSPQAFLEYIAMLEHYDVDFLQDVHESIAEGADGTCYSAFRDKWVSATFGDTETREANPTLCATPPAGCGKRRE